jgi:tripartite motif-containing protein 71
MRLSLEFAFSFAWDLPPPESGTPNPQGIAVDSSGNVYVADSQNQQVLKFDGKGNYLTKIPIAGNPSDVAVDASGNVYIAAYVGLSVGTRILRYDSSGTLTADFGGTAGHEFKYVVGVTLDPSDEYVYVVDNGNSVVMKFSSLLSPSSWESFLGTGTPGSGPGEFNSPTKLAVDLFGNLYVTDSTNKCVQQFDSSGNYLNTWDSTFDEPTGIAAGRISFDPPPHTPHPVPSRGPYAFIFVVDTGNNRCQVNSQSGSSAGQFGSSGSKEGQFGSPYGITVGEYIYVVDSKNNRVQAFNWGWSRSDL